MKLLPIKTIKLNEASSYKTGPAGFIQGPPSGGTYKIFEMHFNKQIPLTYS